MSALTQIKSTQKASLDEIARGVSESGSWHGRYKHSACVCLRLQPPSLTRLAATCMRAACLTSSRRATCSQSSHRCAVAAQPRSPASRGAQCGEMMDVNLVRDAETGKSKGFAFLAYEDQRSTVLAVDNLNGATVLGRTVRVEHVDDYLVKKKEVEQAGGRVAGDGPLAPPERAPPPPPPPRPALPDGATVADEPSYAWGAPPPARPREPPGGAADASGDAALLAAVKARKAAIAAAVAAQAAGGGAPFARPLPPPPPPVLRQPAGEDDAARLRREAKAAKRAKKEARRGRKGGSSESDSRERHRRRGREDAPGHQRRSRSRSREERHRR